MKRFIIYVLGVLFISTAGLFAQDDTSPINMTYEREPIYLGFTFGYNRVLHQVTKPTNDLEKELCPTFENGEDNGFWAGITYEHFFGKIESSTQSLIFRALYSTYPSYLEIAGQEYPKNVRIYEDGKLVDSKIENTAVINKDVVDYSVLSFEIAYKIKPISGINLGITVGPAFDYAITSTNRQTFELLTPENAQFKEVSGKEYTYEDNNRTIVIADGDILESQQLRIGLKVGLQYEINIPGGWYIVPVVYYNFGLTNLSNALDWRVDALQMGIDIRRPIVLF